MRGTMFVIFFLIIILLISLCIAAYVYRDAKNRGMNPVLWTLIVFLAPSWIGFMIYMIVRGSYSNLKCPRCKAEVQEGYRVCPECGKVLKASCGKCGASVEEGWKTCPYCAEPLAWEKMDFVPPVREKDRMLGKILLLVLLTPVLLILLAVFSFGALGGGSYSSGFVSYEVDEYRKLIGEEQADAWLEEAGGRYDTAYVLRHAVRREDGTYENSFAVYVPCVGEDTSVGLGGTASFFGKRALRLDLESGGQTGNVIFCVTSYADEEMGLKVYCDGKKLDTVFRDVGFNPVPGEQTGEVPGLGDQGFPA